MPKSRILVIEDHEINQELLLEMLDRMNLATDVAATGKEALDKHKEINYDLILLDLQLPEMDGYEVAKKIRDSETGKKHIPIVAITASVHKDEKEKCLKAGMDDFIGKPFELHDIENMIKKYLPE